MNPVCTCGDDFSRNGGHVHNYTCPCTIKCQHPVSRINIQTGEIEQGPCGSRLEPQYACHGIGCPLDELCPHCGTSMNQRGVHSRECPNNQYTRNRLIDPENHNYFDRIMSVYQFIQSVPLPPIVDENFDVSDECAVCLSNFSNFQVVMKPSACPHCFHDRCMMQWIESDNANSRKCPLCRIQIESIKQQLFQNYQ